MKNLLYLLLLSFAFSSCKDEEYDNIEEYFSIELPDYSETGAQTLGCLIDKDVWRTFGKREDGGFLLQPITWEPNETMAYYDGINLSVNGIMTIVHNSKVISEQYLGIYFEVDGNNPVGTYLLTDSISQMRHYAYSSPGDYVSVQRNPVLLDLNKFDLFDKNCQRCF